MVVAGMEANPFSERRGMGDIWEAAAANQETLYFGKSATKFWLVSYLTLSALHAWGRLYNA